MTRSRKLLTRRHAAEATANGRVTPWTRPHAPDGLWRVQVSRDAVQLHRDAAYLDVGGEPAAWLEPPGAGARDPPVSAAGEHDDDEDEHDGTDHGRQQPAPAGAEQPPPPRGWAVPEQTPAPVLFRPALRGRREGRITGHDTKYDHRRRAVLDTAGEAYGGTRTTVNRLARCARYLGTEAGRRGTRPPAGDSEERRLLAGRCLAGCARGWVRRGLDRMLRASSAS